MLRHSNKTHVAAGFSLRKVRNLKVAATDLLECLNPKYEIRNPKQIQNQSKIFNKLPIDLEFRIFM